MRIELVKEELREKQGEVRSLKVEQEEEQCEELEKALNEEQVLKKG
ncbi:hypothetical protein AGMMS49921_10890 [Endomicrobiia bacterium]|nr:hypothetical protein AGMMS49921_10890 [Endomicrobiia bacterium]